MENNIKVRAAGEIQIDAVALLVLLVDGTAEVDLSRVFAEINLFEDLFSNSMYGNILIGDANNLLDQLSIQGLEGIRLDLRTPGMNENQRFSKTFGIYSISDQQVVNNDRYQSYRLHFASLELLNDALNKPLNRPIPAKADSIQPLQNEIVPFLFAKYVVREGANQIPRNLKLVEKAMTKDGVSDLIMGASIYDYKDMTKGKYDNVYQDDDDSTVGTTKIQFIAPNWTPLKSINWVANRAIPQKKEQGGTFLFFESNKAYHFASIDQLIKKGKTTSAQMFKYEYTPANIVSPVQQDQDGYSLDVPKEYGRVLKMQVSTNLNLLDNQNMMYFGSQIRSVDPLLKRYREHNHSATDNYDNLEHTVPDDKKPVGIFPKAPNKMLGKDDTTIDLRRNIAIRYRQPYFQFDNEMNPIVSHVNWLSQRAARVAALSNFSIQILVNGRTDIKVGDVIDFKYPSLRGDKDDQTSTQDKFFNGFFLITAIRHFISPIKHTMTLEIIKDGLSSEPDKSTSTDPTGLPIAIDP